jgi:integrase
MRLSALAAQYVAYKQSMGMRFHTEDRTLRSFCRAMGDIALAEVAADHVRVYIAGTGPVTRFWHRKHEVLRGFYRFAMARGYAASSPLPKIVPKPPHFVPHIFSHEELQRLLDTTACCESPRSKLQPYTCRMLILLLYGTGLRISEALSLTLANVDLPAGMGDEEYLETLAKYLPDVLSRSQPDIVLYQAGCDTLAGDPLAGLAMTPEGIVRRDAMVIDACRQRGIPVAMTLGGGYSPIAWKAQAASIARTIEKHGLRGVDRPDGARAPMDGRRIGDKGTP